MKRSVLEARSGNQREAIRRLFAKGRRPNDPRPDFSRENSSVQLHNSIDTAFILPQYLVLRTSPVLQVGWLFAIGSPKCKGKSFTEEPSWQPRRRQKRRNINQPSARRYFAKAEILTSLSGEAPLERHFRFAALERHFHTLVQRRVKFFVSLPSLCHNTETKRGLSRSSKDESEKKKRGQE